MPLSFPTAGNAAQIVGRTPGRTPWSARVPLDPLFAQPNQPGAIRERPTRALPGGDPGGRGVRPTIITERPVVGKLCGIRLAFSFPWIERGRVVWGMAWHIDSYIQNDMCPGRDGYVFATRGPMFRCLDAAPRPSPRGSGLLAVPIGYSYIMRFKICGSLTTVRASVPSQVAPPPPGRKLSLSTDVPSASRYSSDKLEP